MTPSPTAPCSSGSPVCLGEGGSLACCWWENGCRWCGGVAGKPENGELGRSQGGASSVTVPGEVAKGFPAGGTVGVPLGGDPSW